MFPWKISMIAGILCVSALFSMAQAATTGLYADQISSDAEFDALSTRGQGVVKTGVVKFLIDNRVAGKPKVYFLNGNYGAPKVPEYVKYHYLFAQKQLQISYDGDTFNNMTYFTNDLQKKKFFAGSIQRYNVGTTNAPKIFYGIQFYPQDQIAEGTVLYALSAVKKVFLISNTPMAFVSYGVQQTAETVRPQLKALGFAVGSVSEIFAAIPYVSMNLGEAWGYLRVYPKADGLKADDIALFNELPLDLSVVAGVITTVVQDPGSHVNLKSKERGTPDMVLRDDSQVKGLIQKWQDKPVHLTVSEDGYRVDAATDAEVQAHHSQPRNRPWVNFKVSSDHTLKTYDEMANVAKASQTIPNGNIFGGKASKNGFLAHRDIVGEGSNIQKSLNYRMTVLGFGVPMSYYQDFVNSNPQLKAKIQIMVDSEMSLNGRSPLDPDKKLKLIDEIQKMFYGTPMPQKLVLELQNKMNQFKTDFAKAYPKSELKGVKIRSSANSEDVEDFDGAGLHDSFGASLKDGLGDPTTKCEIKDGGDGVETKQEMSPNSVVCAVKGVYASLWNRRAIEERSYAHINHATAAMGIAVNQKYNFREKTEGITEVANAVVVTRILAASGVYGYQISMNTADNLVTNPTPGTQSEMVLASFLDDEKPEYTVTQFAITEKGQAPRKQLLVNRAVYDRIVSIARAVEEGYCRAVPGYYDYSCSDVPWDLEKPKSLDMEFKIFSNGEVLVKQTREFSGH